VKAKERYKVVTQMGNQGHAGDGIRRSVEAVQSGLIGEVGQVYCRNDGPKMGGTHFGNPVVMPPPSTPVPAGFAWDLWLGPAKKRDFNSEYHPAKWRAFWDFGLGMLGDFGCHTLDTPVWALDLAAPNVVECLHRERSLDGVIGCGTHAGEPLILPEDVRSEWEALPPALSNPRVAGGSFREWLRAIKGEGPEPGSNFSYAAKLTEIILLGVLAQRFNTRIEWDSKTGQIANQPELNAYVKEPVREGWSYGEDLWK
jgi:Oxidoreductase family, C-terminal alpha/beta domain